MLFFFLCTAVKGDIGKHIFVPKSKAWLDAQTYCREHYTDLSFISSQSQQDKLLTAADGPDAKGWIGLYRDPNNSTAWKWSGGEYITYQNWGKGQPDNYKDIENNGHVNSDGQWNDANDATSMNFYCISISVVEVRKTWEEALEYCRETHTDLTSLLSKTEHRLAQKVMQKVDITEPVWIGLRYLEDRWLWVNGDPLVYQASPQGGDQCPIWNRCGALTKEGLLKNWNCQEQLNFICN